MPRPRTLPADPDATQTLEPRLGPRTWGGKIHDPRAIWEAEVNAKKEARNADFQAGQTKNVLSRMSQMEEAQERTEQKLDKLIAALTPKVG